MKKFWMSPEIESMNFAETANSTVANEREDYLFAGGGYWEENPGTGTCVDCS